MNSHGDFLQEYKIFIQNIALILAINEYYSNLPLFDLKNIFILDQMFS
jgi:hypothetical protein